MDRQEWTGVDMSVKVYLICLGNSRQERTMGDKGGQGCWCLHRYCFRSSESFNATFGITNPEVQILACGSLYETLFSGYFTEAFDRDMEGGSSDRPVERCLKKTAPFYLA